MRILTSLLFIILFASCNNSTETTETNQTATDPVQVDEKPVEVFEPTSLSASDIPETVSFEGNVKYVYRWKDKLGDNLFFVSVRGPYPDNDKGEAEEEGKTADLYVYHYIRDGEEDYRIHWKMHDQELSCPFDVTAEFIPGSVTVTDLDKDSIGEAKFQYALACRSDVSPASMKLVIEENKQVYTLTGNRWIQYSPDLKFDVNASNVNLEKLPMLDDGEDDLLRSFGRYRSEKEFASAPASFLEYARNEWLKYVIEKI